MIHRDRDSNEALLMKPNNSSIKKKQLWIRGCGKEGEEKINK